MCAGALAVPYDGFEKVRVRELNPRLGHHKAKGYHYPNPDTHSDLTH
jgi:hypothetical protein